MADDTFNNANQESLMGDDEFTEVEATVIEDGEEVEQEESLEAKINHGIGGLQPTWPSFPTPFPRVRTSFLEYSMSVIVARALPDVRDGLKPVHRRILYAMYESGITTRQAPRKCADPSVRCWASTTPTATPPSTTRWCVWRRISPCATRWWTATVTSAPSMATAGSLPLHRSPHEQDGHGDAWPTSKRTPSTGTPTSTRAEGAPACCPARFPNLLVNGSPAASPSAWPPTSRPTTWARSLTAASPYGEPGHRPARPDGAHQGPRLPHGGIIMGRSGIRAAYATGRGNITLRQGACGEEQSGRTRIVMTEIPYQVNKAAHREDRRSGQGEASRGIPTSTTSPTARACASSSI